MKLGGLLKMVAPTITKTVMAGNPVAGMAVKMLTNKLGIDEKDPVKIEKFIEEHPERLEEVKAAEADFIDRTREMEIELEAFKVETVDRKDARRVFGNDPTPKVFAVLSLLGFLAYIFLVTTQPASNNNDATVNLILGYLGGLVSGISGYFFGSSHNGNK